jgi:hypothetical protein
LFSQRKIEAVPLARSGGEEGSIGREYKTEIIIWKWGRVTGLEELMRL